MLEELTVVKSVTQKPEGIIWYSKSGLGKTTIICNAIKDAKNGILFECGEEGLSDSTDKDILDTPHYKEPICMGRTQDELIDGWIRFKEDIIRFLMVKDHKFDAVGFDNFDNIIKNNLDAYITKTVYNNNLDKANGWGGAKLVEMDAELALIIKAFEYLQKKGIKIYLTCHDQIITFKDPIVEDYNKYTLGVPSRKDADLKGRLINWSSATLFGTKDVVVENKKAIDSKRVLKTRECAAWDAKCRYSIPETIDFSYEAFKNAINQARK